MPHLDDRTAATATPSPGDLGGAGLRAFFRIVKIWKLTEEHQIRLLGLTVRSTLFAWKSKAANGPVKLGPDTLERLGNLVGIWKALAILCPEDEIADRWIHLPNDNYPFMGDSPLTLMQFSMEGLAQVRRHLDARRGGWG
ncbi:MAG: MbcA/ParS/Xre antitoxin family protein [Holophaga sp.]|nr:MbcA/ParS/Xre antitoxin family protein [Holophaga sp.]